MSARQIWNRYVDCQAAANGFTDDWREQKRLAIQNQSIEVVDVSIKDKQTAKKTNPLVRFLPGDSTECWRIVAYVSDFPRNEEGDCAYCAGDPCAERPITPQTAEIHRYWRVNDSWAESCPVCQGKPS